MSDYEDQQRKKRLEDLENKRKRLEEMRKLKKDRTQQSSSSSNLTATGGTPATAPGASSSSKDIDTINVDELVNSLLSPTTAAATGSADPSASLPSPPTTSENLMLSSPTNNMNHEEIRKMKSKELVTVSNVVQINIFPCISETYEKETQVNLDEFIDEKVTDATQTPHRRMRSESIPPILNTPSSPIRQRAPSFTEVDPTTSSSSQEIKKSLTTEEVHSLLNEDSFKSFMKSSSHVMTRALGLSNSIDILKDYTGADRGNNSAGNQSAIMSKVRNFFNISVQDRPIMDIQMSPHHTELFLVAYGSKPTPQTDAKINLESYDNQPGLLCLWSVILKDTPEFIFTAPSPVLTARFHSDDPHLIVGGCYSGQIVMWDTRVMSHRPTLRSAIAGKGHKHPVYSMCLAKSGVSSPILITASTDGTLCHWDLTNLNDPISSTILLAPLMPHPSDHPTESGNSTQTLPSYMLVNSSQSSRGKPVPASCMSLGPDEENRKLIIGTEGGALCLFTLPLKPNTQFEQVNAHYGMITAITTNPSTVKPFKDLILTSSVDWTVKLWNIQRIGTAPSPIFEFSASAFDYYSSVRWCPIHPGTFTTITSGGVLMLWNLCQSIVEPVGTLRLHQDEKDFKSSTSTPGTATATATMSALNKTVWISDGKKLLIGDSRGNTNMISIRPSVISLRAGDEMKLEFYLESSNLKISSLSSNPLRSMSGIAGAGSRDVLDTTTGDDLEEVSSINLHGLDETKGP